MSVEFEMWYVLVGLASGVMLMFASFSAMVTAETINRKITMSVASFIVSLTFFYILFKNFAWLVMVVGAGAGQAAG